MFEKFEESLQEDEKLTDAPSELLNKLSNDPCHENLQQVIQNETCCRLFKRYEKFKKSVKEGKMVKTSQYLDWLHRHCLVYFVNDQSNKAQRLTSAHIILISSSLFAFDHTNISTDKYEFKSNTSWFRGFAQKKMASAFFGTLSRKMSLT